jgi:hypothetical protein
MINLLKIFCAFSGAFILGVFPISNIILPIFYTFPRIRAYKIAGSLEKEIPLIKIFWPPLFWSIILFFVLRFVDSYFQNYLLEIYLGLVFASIKIINSIIKKEPSQYEDFLNSYKQYLK